MPAGPEYLTDPMVLLYLLSAFLIAALSTGVFLFERFGGLSRQYLTLSLIMAGWVALLGMTHGAPDPAAEHFWLRAAYLIMPFMVPAAYDMVARMAGGGPVPQRLVWAGGVIFALVNAAGPWLVDGLQALLVDGAVARGGWLGGLYLAFEIGGMATVVGYVGWSRRSPETGEARVELAGLLTAGVIGSLPLLDYFLARDPFRAGLLTPLAVIVGGTLAALLAVRFRIFAPARDFGTDEVVETMADAVIVSDPAGRIRSVNPAAEKLLHRRESQLVGRPVGDIVGRKVDGAWEPFTSLGESSREQLELRTRHGGPVPVQASIEPIRFGGRAAGAVIVARDIRQRLKTQRALEASQRRYASLFWHNPAILYECDREGRIVEVNPTTEEMLGIPSAELRGQRFDHLIAPGDLDDTWGMYQKVLGGQAQEYELAVQTARGERRQLRGVSIPIFEGAEVTGVFGVAVDVTEQNRIKQELEVQRRYFVELFNSSPEGIVLVDPHTDEVLRVNQEFTRMFGYDGREVLGRKLTDLIVPEDRREEGMALNREANSTGQVRRDTVRQRKDGSLVEVSVLARELRIPGEPRQLYAVYRDISARKEAERALQQREDELRHAQRLEAVGKLAGGIAHDFNNLLTVINGQARFALDAVPGDSPIQDELEEIVRAGSRAASLTQQLLAYSRRQMLRPRVLDLNEVLRELQGMLRRLIGEHIRMETRYTAEPARVRADRGQIEQVAINLAVNARDAMPGGGTLTLETGTVNLAPDDDRVERWDVEAGEFVWLRVADEGMGMDPETLERAFEPFYTTKEQGKGTGLGLSTVFGIVKQSGGHVTVGSEAGAGTAVEVYLPRSEREPAAEHARPAEAADAPTGATALVVEDEDAVRDLIVKTLEKESCTVLAAEDGARALTLLEEHAEAIDIVITDVVMPTMGGRQLAERIRERRPDLPILFMSGYDDAMAQGAGTGAGTEFLAKPFTPAALVRRVTEVMDD